MFDSYKLNGDINIRNRFIMAPMTTFSSNKDLSISDEELKFYEARSKDVGMVITSESFFQEIGQGYSNQFFAGNDSTIPSLKKVAAAIHSGGAKAILQVGHKGRKALPNKDKLVSASAIKGSRNHLDIRYFIPKPRSMTNREIEDFIEGFYQCSRRAIQSGFDGIEIHGMNLLQQFFSGASNHREDKWGGSLENRIRLPLEVINSIDKAKKDCDAPNFIVGYRFNPEERGETGINLEQCSYFVDKLCESTIDYLHLSQKKYYATSARDKTNKYSIGEQLSKVIKSRKVLVGVGEIVSLDSANDAIKKNGYDLVAIARLILTDPRCVSKMETGEPLNEYMDYKQLDKQIIPKNLAMTCGMVPDWIKNKNQPPTIKIAQSVLKKLM